MVGKMGNKHMHKSLNELLKNVENYTESMLLNVFNELAAPIQMERLISRYKITVSLENLVHEEYGAIKIDENSAIMLINKNDSITRQRFTMAHELGHFISYKLQGKTGRRIDYRNGNSSSGKDLEEVFANKFAAAILMPKSLLLKALEITGDIKSLASIFNVSAEAMTYRLEAL